MLKVAGADLVDGTPIYDIKPYLPYADCRPEATGGFTDRTDKRTVEVAFEPGIAEKLTEEEEKALRSVLKEDPRPAYQDDPERVYGFGFAGRQIRFRVRDGVLTVIEIERG